MNQKSMISVRGSNSNIARSIGVSLLDRLLSANRYVLGGALFVAILIPEMLHGFVHGWGIWFDRVTAGFEPSIAAVALAIISAHLSLARISVLPLVSAQNLLLPTFITAFGAVMLIFTQANFDLDRYHFWTGFLLSVGWSFGLLILRKRYLPMRIGIVGMPEGFGDDLPGNVEWVLMTEPDVEHRVNAVAVDPHAVLSVEWSRRLTRYVLDQVPVYQRGQIEEGLTGRVRFHHHADNEFGALLPTLGYLRVKRLIDLVAALVILPLFLIVIAIAAIAIRLDSPGPALFRQVRMGHRGLPFLCFKLRTMRIDVEGPQYTVEDDPRITRLGRMLRKWRIDELPQIFNVIRGEMSWIGPRPEALELAQYYADHVPFYDYRHAVRPGLSGWAAVHQGNVGELDAAQEKLEYDFFYIRNFSIWLDMLILFKTIRTIWSGFGSR